MFSFLNHGQFLRAEHPVNVQQDDKFLLPFPDPLDKLRFQAGAELGRRFDLITIQIHDLLHCVYFGAQNNGFGFYLQFHDNDAGVDRIFRFCTEVVVAYGRAMIATGVHGIQYGDSTASLVSPEHYQQFALPYQQQSVEALAGKNCDIWIHICGDSRHILHLLKGLNIQGFEVDAKVKMATARKLLGDRIAIKGNLDTTFLLMESPEAVYKATRDILKSGNFKTGMVMSPGCGVAKMTPVENLKAITRACRDYEL